MKDIEARENQENKKEGLNEVKGLKGQKNDLIIKEVNFNGSTLIAVQECASGKIYVGVSYICKGIGLTNDQVKNERKKIQKDLVLSKGGLYLTIPTTGGIQEVLCIELDFLPLWLAKISITPAMKKESEEEKQKEGKNYITVVDRLIKYQLRAKDELAEAFLQEEKVDAFIKNYLQRMGEKPTVSIVG